MKEKYAKWGKDMNINERIKYYLNCKKIDKDSEYISRFLMDCECIKRKEEWDDFQTKMYNSIKSLYGNNKERFKEYYKSNDTLDENKEKRIVNKIRKLGAYLFNIYSRNMKYDYQLTINNISEYIKKEEDDSEDFERNKTIEEILFNDEIDLLPPDEFDSNNLLLIFSCVINTEEISMDKVDSIDIYKEVEMVQPICESKGVKVVSLLTTYDEQIEYAINYYKPKYVHFIGHSAPKGIFVNDKWEHAVLLQADGIKKMIKYELDTLFLNSCYSSSILSDIKATNIKFGIGHDDRVSDFYSRYFSSFYYNYYFDLSDNIAAFNEAKEVIRKDITSNGPLLTKYVNKRITDHPVDYYDLCSCSKRLTEFLNQTEYLEIKKENEKEESESL